MKDFSFEPLPMLFEAQRRLRRLLTGEAKEDEASATTDETGEACDEEEDSLNVSDRTAATPLDEASLGEEASQDALTAGDTASPDDRHFYHDLVQEALERAAMSPRAVVLGDAWDDESCATMY